MFERASDDDASLRKILDDAFMRIESKYWIRNNKDLEDAFRQVWSYGVRLSSKILLIIDKDAIWLYESKNGYFDRSHYLKKYWKELETADEFKRMKLLISRYAGATKH